MLILKKQTRIKNCYRDMKKIVNPWKGLDGYMCFGCSPDNPSGLHMEFFEDGEDIVAFWEPGKYYQGWLRTLHGGIQATLMDELAGWVVLRKLQTSGVTSRMEVKFMKSISTDEPCLMIRGRMTDRKRNAIFIETEIYDSAGTPCSRANLVYFVSPQERAMEEFGFKGCKTEDEC